MPPVKATKAQETPAPTTPPSIELPSPPVKDTSEETNPVPVQAKVEPEGEPVAPSVTDDGTVINWQNESEEPVDPEVIAGVETVEGDLEVLKVTEPLTEPSSTTQVPKVDPTAATPTEPAAPVVTPEQVPAPAPVAEAAPVVQPQPVPPPAEPVTMSPEEALKWEQGEIDKLTPLYKLSDDEAQAVMTEPEVVMPKLAAIVHYKVTRAVLASLQHMLPQMMDSHSATASTTAEARTAFYSANPDLDKPEFEQAVLQVGELYRKVNPKAPRAEAIQMIGAMSRQALGIAPLVSTTAPEGGEIPQVQPTGNVVPIAPTAPAVPVVAKAKPFIPARGGTGAAKKTEPNEWLDILEEEN